MTQNKPRQRWYYWLDQLRSAGRTGVLAQDAVVRDPDRCNAVLRDKGYDIGYRIQSGNTRYTLLAEPDPHIPKPVSTFPGDTPEVDDNQERLF